MVWSKLVVIRLKFMVRELVRSDYDDLFRLIQNSRTEEVLSQSLSYAEFTQKYDEYLKGPQQPMMVFVVLLDDKLVGKLELSYEGQHKIGQFDIVIDKNLWGKGIAQKALHVLFQYAFTQIGLNKMIAEVLAFNVRSISFMRKMGMQLEGILREEKLVGEQYVDIYRFGLLRKEYQEGYHDQNRG